MFSAIACVIKMNYQLTVDYILIQRKKELQCQTQ